MLRNSEWGNAFIDHWLAVSSARNKYPFTDNGGFAETVMRFGTRHMPPHCRYNGGDCLAKFTKKMKPQEMSKAWVNCLGVLSMFHKINQIEVNV
jgi:hypothetical protein